MMKKIFGVVVFSTLLTAAAFAAQVLDLSHPEVLSNYGSVSQAPGASNGLVFMAHVDCAVTTLPSVVKKVDWKGGSAIMASDLPISILRGEEITVWYNQKVTPQGFVQQDETPADNDADHAPTTPTSDDVTAPAEPVSDDATGPEVNDLAGLEKVGQVRDRENSVWVDFAPTSNGTFGGELVAFKVTGFNSQERVETFRVGLGYIVAEADVLENKGGSYTNTIARLLTLNLPGFDSSSERYEDGNIRVTLHIATGKFFYGSNVFKITGAEQLLTDPNGGAVYMADGADIGPISVFMKSELADPKDGDGSNSSGGGGGCDAAGLGLPALGLLAIFLKRKSR